MKQFLPQRSKKNAGGRTSPFTGRAHRLILAVVIVLMLVCAGYIGSALLHATAKADRAANPTPTPKSTYTSSVRTPSLTPTIIPTPTGPLNWSTVQTFTGKGTKKTPPFTAPRIWRIAWSCDPSSPNNTNYDLIIHANTVTNTLLASGVETTCNKKNTHSSTVMYQGGKIYLSIISEGNWVVQVQYSKS